MIIMAVLDIMAGMIKENVLNHGRCLLKNISLDQE